MDKLVFSLILEIGELTRLKPEDKIASEASLKHKVDAENIYFTAQRLENDKVLKKGNNDQSLPIFKNRNSKIRSNHAQVDISLLMIDMNLNEVIYFDKMIVLI
ncbi:hypothetical protein [Sphingobacterium faecium]|uniref:hypothetical protein n=1 Tax=Sphingobacterium faecium TaxID=34087 RepID=UPI00320BA246